MQSIHFVCLIICIHVNLSSGESITSCANKFQYQREGNEWIGLVQVQVHNNSSSTKIFKFEFLLTLPGQLPSVSKNYFQFTCNFTKGM